MDDFIDDGPEEMEDYSKYIKDIFGYDKSKYRGLDEDDIDNMESTFAQQMREDIRSTKLGKCFSVFINLLENSCVFYNFRNNGRFRRHTKRKRRETYESQAKKIIINIIYFYIFF